MSKSVFKVAIATILFAAVHSLLASTWAERQATDLFGERTVRGLYRPIFCLLAAIFTTLLAVFYFRQPSHDVYRVTGIAAWIMRLLQGGAALFAAWAAYDVGSGFMLGTDGLDAWREGAEILPRTPDGQGPVVSEDGTIRATGPFAFVRQPLNLVILPLVWLNPRMTGRLFGFSVVATIYVMLAVLHTEAHMVDAYGELYRQYQREVPLIPGVW